MAFVDVPQLSADWLKMRVGCVSASHLGDVMAKLKPVKKAEGEIPNHKEAAPRLIYRKKKVMEMLTGLTADSYVTPYMQAGIDVEVLARAAYEFEREVEVLHGGLFVHDKIARFVASPDGRVGEGLLEIKYLTGVTTDANHIDLIRGAAIPDEYQWQMLGQLSCSGWPWVDFVSYQPAPMPKNLRLHIRRFHRDEKHILSDGKPMPSIAEMEKSVEQFTAEVDAMLESLKQDDPASLEGVLSQSLKVLVS
jgi:hypothetical protein